MSRCVWIAFALWACGAPSRATPAPATVAAPCAEARANIHTRLLATPAADDVAEVVLATCQQTPHVAGCLATAESREALLACLPPLDDEGSEGLRFAPSDVTP